MKWESELSRYWVDRFAFLCEEIEHAYLMCSRLAAADPSDQYAAQGTLFFDRLRVILGHVRKHIPALSEATRESYELWNHVEEIITWLPQTLDNFLSVHQARRLKAPRLTTRAAQFALSEVHPEYPETLRAIQRLSLSYYDALRPVLGPFASHAPMLGIANGSIFSLKGFPVACTNPVLYETYATYVSAPATEKLAARDKWLREVVQDRVSLAWISLPRWAPIHLRFLGGLSHEILHVLTTLVVSLYEEALYRTGVLGIERAEVLAWGRSFFGAPICELFEIVGPLIDDLERHFAQLKSPRSRYTGGADACTFVRLNTKTSAVSCGLELLCDVGSVVLGGFASIPSLMAAGFPLRRRADTLLNPLIATYHPPTSVRVDLMWDLWKEFVGKDVKFVKGFEAVKQEYEQGVKGLTDEEEMVTLEFRDWTKSHMKEIDRLFLRMQAMMPNSSAGRTDHLMKLLHPPNLERVTRDIFNVDDPGPGLTSLDIPNVIWFKRILCGDWPCARSPWRIAILSS